MALYYAGGGGDSSNAVWGRLSCAVGVFADSGAVTRFHHDGRKIFTIGTVCNRGRSLDSVAKKDFARAVAFGSAGQCEAFASRRLLISAAWKTQPLCRMLVLQRAEHGSFRICASVFNEGRRGRFGYVENSAQVVAFGSAEHRSSSLRGCLRFRQRERPDRSAGCWCCSRAEYDCFEIVRAFNRRRDGSNRGEVPKLREVFRRAAFRSRP